MLFKPYLSQFIPIPINESKPTDDSLGKPKPYDYPGDEENIKPKHYKCRPEKKIKKKKPSQLDDDQMVSDDDVSSIPEVTTVMKEKPILQEIITVEVKPTKVQPFILDNIPLFATIKLKKAPTRPKNEVESVTVPKVLLKSHLKKIEFNTNQQFPLITLLEPVYVDNGVISRNYTEAMKIKKTKPRKLKIPELEPVVLEKFEPTDFHYDKKDVPERKPSLIKDTKEKTEPDEQIPKKLVIGKGKMPVDKDDQENVVLKKVPKKPDEENIEVSKQIDKPKFKPEIEVKPQDDYDISLKPFKPLMTGESPEDVGQITVQSESVPEEELPVDKTKYVRKKPKKETEAIPDKKLILGTPKPIPAEEDKDIQLKYKQGKPEPELPEEIKLKPIPKEKPIDESKPIDDSIGKPKPLEYPRDEEKIKPKHYKYKPEKKIKNKPNKPDHEQMVSDNDVLSVPELTAIERKNPVLQEIITVEVKPTKIQPVILENKPLFATIKLRKAPTKPKNEVASVTVPKILLKSHLKEIEFNTHEHFPTITLLEPVYVDNGVISRNYVEAMKLKKTKPRKFKLPELEPVILEKFEPTDFHYDKKDVPERKPSLIKDTKEKTEPDEQIPKKLVIGKGKMPVEKDDQEDVVLKKVPKKPDEENIEVPKQIDKPKFKPEPEVRPQDDYDISLKPFKLLSTGDCPEDVDQIPVQPESVPEEELPVDKTKYVRKKPKKQTDSIPDKKLVLGTPKPVPTEEDKDIKLKYKQGKPEPELPEEIKLKPIPKEIPIDESKPIDDSLGKPKPYDYPGDEENIKPKHYKCRPEKKIKKKKPSKPEEEVSVDSPLENLEIVSKENLESNAIENEIVAPYFIEKVQPLVAEHEKPTAFMCSVGGIPTPEVKWYRDDHELQTTDVYEIIVYENTSTLRISKPTEEQAGVYVCQATNLAGISTCTALLVVLDSEEIGEAPTFIEPIKPKKVKAKKSIELRCVVKGIPIPEVIWCRENEEIISDDEEYITSFNSKTGEAILTIVKPMDVDQSTYLARAVNIHGKSECMAHITFEKEEYGEAPKFIERLKPKVVKANEKTELSCLVKGIPTPTVIWCRDDEEIIPDDSHLLVHISETGESKLIILHPDDIDESTYTVNATNKFGRAECRANLIVQKDEFGEAPTFVLPVQPKITKANELTELKCTVRGTPKPLVIWCRGDEEIIPDECHLVTYYPETGESKLTILNPTEIDETTYTVNAVNKYGQAQCRANLIIQKDESGEAPIFVEPLKPKVAKANETTVLNCMVRGTPTPTVVWFRENEEVIPDNTHSISFIPETGESKLVIAKATEVDQSTYTVKATNKYGRAQCRANLIIQEDVFGVAPTFVESIKPVLVKPDQTTVLRCLVTGNPMPTVIWCRGKEEIIPDDTHTIQFIPETGESTLTISKATKIDEAHYSVEATNKFGRSRCRANLVLEQYDTGVAPAFVVPIKPKAVKPTKTVELRCVVTGIPMPTVVWCRGDEQIVPDDSHVISYLPETGESKLTICKATELDVNDYTVKAVNNFGVAECKANVIIDEEIIEETKKPEETPIGKSPYFETELQTETVWEEEEEDITKRLVVRVKGTPKPTVRWYENGVEIVPNDEFEIEEFDEETSILTIRKRQTENIREITCEAVNEYGTATTKTIVIPGIKGTKAYRKPLWVTQMEELREQLKGKCTADSVDACCVYRPEHRDDDPGNGYGTYFAGYDVKGAFYLSPIQEHSEPSSSDGGSDRIRSLSCHELASSAGGRRRDEDEDATGRSQTYPRSHADETVAQYNRRKYAAAGYPLEPRELDPEMFFQLHTADSQDELQEFLLLESQCMSTDNGGGLHAAFVDKPKKQ